MCTFGYADWSYLYTLCFCVGMFTDVYRVGTYSDGLGVCMFIMRMGFTYTLTVPVDVCSLTVTLYAGVLTV